MKMTGELLKAERIKQDLKIADIAFALKLSNKVIQSIEEGDQESLPAKTFVRGFVKSYAEFLKLDSTVVLKQFQEEMGSTRPVPKTPPPIPVSEHARPATNKTKPEPKPLDENAHVGLTRRHLMIFVTVTFFIALLTLINHFVNKYSKERVDSALAVEKSQPVHVSAAVASSDSQLALLSATMGQTVPSSTDSTGAIETQNNIVADAHTVNAEIAKKEDFPSLAKSNGKAVEVLIEAKKDLVIQYAKGNSSVFEKISVKENSYQIIRSTSGLHLRTADGQLMVLTVNGILQPTIKSKIFQQTF
jgi:cytoskeletal protein RodZ